MPVRRLETCNGFVVEDLAVEDGQPPVPARGVVRCAPKVLVDGAQLLARSVTYGFASFGIPQGGASAAINASADDRAEAVAAFAAEVRPDVEAGRLVLDAGKGVPPSALATLYVADGRGGEAVPGRELLLAASVVAAIDADGPLDGRGVAVEIVDGSTAAVVEQLHARGGRLVAVGGPAGAVVDPAGLDAVAVVAALREHGVDAVAHLDRDAEPAAALFTAPAEVLCVGSKAGVLDHVVADAVEARLVVPVGPVPVTAKALASLTRAGTTVLPDFVTLAGPLVGDPADPTAVASEVAAVLDEVRGSERGPLLAACERAEGFLRSWRSSLPFGRPLA